MYNTKDFLGIKSIKEPSKGLLSTILVRINTEKAKDARKKALFSGIVSFLSLISMFGTGQYLATEFYRTGFNSYASLLVSDWSSIIFFWKEVLISLAESLPIFGLIALFGIITIFLESIKIIIKNLENVNYLKAKTI